MGKEIKTNLIWQAAERVEAAARRSIRSQLIFAIICVAIVIFAAIQLFENKL